MVSRGSAMDAMRLYVLEGELAGATNGFLCSGRTRFATIFGLLG